MMSSGFLKVSEFTKFEEVSFIRFFSLICLSLKVRPITLILKWKKILILKKLNMELLSRFLVHKLEKKKKWDASLILSYLIISQTVQIM